MLSNKMKKNALGLMAFVSLAAAGSASAQMVVYDPVNETHQIAQEVLMGSQLTVSTGNAIANKLNAGFNFGSLIVLEFMKHEIKSIRHSLTELEPGNMLDVTTNIYNDIHNIDKNITTITDITEKNYDIDNDFTWITNNFYGDAVECPPDATPEECSVIIGRADTNLAKLIDKGTVDQYMSNYKDARYYQNSVADKSNLTNVGFAAAANQKLANDALAQALSTQRNSLMGQSAGLTKLIEGGMHAQGHGKQLQYANALAGQQAVQMAEMRSLMLASESARAASAQAAADKEARQVASKQNLRRGLDQASVAGSASKSAPQY